MLLKIHYSLLTEVERNNLSLPQVFLSKRNHYMVKEVVISLVQ